MIDKRHYQPTPLDLANWDNTKYQIMGDLYVIRNVATMPAQTVKNIVEVINQRLAYHLNADPIDYKPEPRNHKIPLRYRGIASDNRSSLNNRAYRNLYTKIHPPK